MPTRSVGERTRNEVRLQEHVTSLSGVHRQHRSDPLGAHRKVSIAGATGVLGRRLVKRFRDRGHPVVGRVRNEAGEKLLSRLGADPVRAHGSVWEVLWPDGPHPSRWPLRWALRWAPRRGIMVLPCLAPAPSDRCSRDSAVGNARIRSKGERP